MITSLLLEILRKIFQNAQGWTEHVCLGSRRVVTMQSLQVLIWVVGRGCSECFSPRETTVLDAELGALVMCESSPKHSGFSPNNAPDFPLGVMAI